MIEVEFTIHLLDENYRHLNVTESDLSENFVAFQARLLEREELEGDIVFKREGFPDLEITDLLLVSIQKICFEFVTQCLQEQIDTFLYNFWVQDEQLVLLPMAGYIRAMMEEMPVVAYPKEDFLRALFACGTRYLLFAQKLASLGRADWSIEKLKEQKAITRAALTEHSLISEL